MSEIFGMATADGKTPTVYVEEFEVRGEVFVIHRKYSGWAASHKEIGMGVPNSQAPEANLAKEKAEKVLASVTDESWAKVFKKA